MELPKPQELLGQLQEHDSRYAIVLEELVTVYPEYAANPGAAGMADVFAEDQANLQQVQADLFLFRDKLETAMSEAAMETVGLEQLIGEYETVDKKLVKRLDGLDLQRGSAEGRLQDAVFLYRESYLANGLLGTLVLAAAYGAYKSMKHVPSQ
jgi:hypothetical protein